MLIYLFSNYRLLKSRIAKLKKESFQIFIYYIHRLFDITYIEYFVRKLIWETVEFY